MSKTIETQVSDDVLKSTTAHSDRYVYSNYFVPVLITFDDNTTPLLPFYVAQKLLELEHFVFGDRFPDYLQDLGQEDLWLKNGLADVPTNWGDPNSTTPPSRTPRRSILQKEEREFVAGLLQSDVGFAFLDRTRLRSVGFAIGEHVYALGLAPGEEVTLEQKTFTKRQVTLEEQTEQERQFDLELSSTYSTELQEGFERQRSTSENWGLNASHSGQYKSPTYPWGEINASHTIGYTKNVAEANQETTRRSVRNGQTASSKVSARYRTQHKVAFKVVSEQGFEVTAKRTIRNPNRMTPITLHYFKVMQRMQLMQERYGVRLCWTPAVKDPARTFFEKIRQGRQRIIDEANKQLPPPPTEPKAIQSGAEPSATTRETKTFTSAIVVADKWGGSGDMCADYDVDIPREPGFTWDGVISSIEGSINVITKREKVSRWIVGMPYPVQGEGGDKLRVRVHIGTDSWLFGPGISFQVSATFYKDVILSVTAQVGENTKYNDDLVYYRTALKEWTDQRDAAIAAAHQAADTFQAQLIKGLSPINEMVSQIVEEHFPASVRDECWEIDLWQRLFDWERASFAAYPNWWSPGDTRDPLLDPSDFINASWAKLYLPVRVGMEKLALRWIFGKAVAVPLSEEREKRFDTLIADLTEFRRTVLGAADEVVELTEECQEVPEKYRCLAKWSELMPTDGTHIEVVQGATSAADAITQKEIADAQDLRAALVGSEQRSAALKDKAQERMTEPATIEVRVGAGAPHPELQ